MSDNFISNVLNILRLIKATPELNGHAPVEYLKKWSGVKIDEGAALRFCAYVQDQCDGALAIINQSSLASEAKAGLIQTVEALRSGFVISHLSTALSTHFPQLDAAISSFAILESVSNLAGMSADTSELESLIEEVEKIAASFDDASIDPIVRETAKKHLDVLLALLRNVGALGVDSAMIAYAELVIRLKRVDGIASETSRSKTATVWPVIEKWGGRLAIIDKAMNSGQGLLDHAVNIGRTLLDYLP